MALVRLPDVASRETKLPGQGRGQSWRLSQKLTQTQAHRWYAGMKATAFLTSQERPESKTSQINSFQKMLDTIWPPWAFRTSV